MIAEHILNAVAHKNRPDSDRERDANRKPGEVLDFFNIKTTDKVGEINSGRGYLSSIIAHALKDGGKMYAHTSPMSVERWKGCLLYTSPSPRDLSTSRMPSSA